MKDPFHSTYKPLKDYSNEELICLLNMNEKIEMSRLGAICAEVLRRLNLKSPFFDEKNL